MVCLFLGIGIFRLSSDDSVSIGSSYTIPLTILQLSERPCNEIDELCYALPPLKAMRRCDRWWNEQVYCCVPSKDDFRNAEEVYVYRKGTKGTKGDDGMERWNLVSSDVFKGLA